MPNFEWYEENEEWSDRHTDFQIKWMFSDWASDRYKLKKKYEAQLREEQFKVILYNKLLYRYFYDNDGSSDFTTKLYSMIKELNIDVDTTTRLPNVRD